MNKIWNNKFSICQYIQLKQSCTWTIQVVSIHRLPRVYMCVKSLGFGYFHPPLSAPTESPNHPVDAAFPLACTPHTISCCPYLGCQRRTVLTKSRCECITRQRTQSSNILTCWLLKHRIIINYQFDEALDNLTLFQALFRSPQHSENRPAKLISFH